MLEDLRGWIRLIGLILFCVTIGLFGVAFKIIHWAVKTSNCNLNHKKYWVNTGEFYQQELDRAAALYEPISIWKCNKCHRDIERNAYGVPEWTRNSTEI